ncbi:hypothetical protein FB550_101781 [Neobacillus bataviensis]|uniref:Uncharacterized protein n=1 Tax=Neobacillus bataviensis TaxID=220685 RepID=A0A561DZF2_9BACI|nr:hypothetical protein [Neobacillus bataviensis]TWE08753.1 hypothetical protein FB550_101781 [Neobacillus bataviensis]
MSLEISNSFYALRRLNELVSIIPRREFDSEENHIVKIEKAYRDIETLNKKLMESSTKNLHDVDQLEDDLVHLHLSYEKLIDNIEELHELVKVITGKYRKTIENANSNVTNSNSNLDLA